MPSLDAPKFEVPIEGTKEPRAVDSQPKVPRKRGEREQPCYKFLINDFATSFKVKIQFDHFRSQNNSAKLSFQ